MLGVLRGDVMLHPPLDSVPAVTTGMLVIVLLGLVAAVVAPQPLMSQETVTRVEEVAGAGAA